MNSLHKLNTPLFFIFILSFGFAASISSANQNTDNSFEVTKETKIIGNDVDQFDAFGTSVSISDKRVVVSADNANSRGSVYVYEYDNAANNWLEKTTLKTLLYSDLFDDFGNSISLDGDLVLVGAPGDNEGEIDSGGAYIFKYNSQNDTWNELPRLYASDRQEGDFFGWSVSIDQDRLIIGARFDDEGTNIDLGSAYIFEYDTVNDIWAETTKLLPSDLQSNLSFGEAVNIFGDWAFVGAPFDATNGQRAGVVYVYRRDSSTNTWNESQKLYPQNPVAEAWFGQSLSTSAGKLLVGAPFDKNNQINTGSVYVFNLDTNLNLWIESDKLTADDGSTADAFGIDVSLFEDRALIGSHRDDDGGNASGSAYLFGFDGKQWNQQKKITASDGAEDTYFGKSVALNKENLIVGSYKDDEVGSNAGAAYIFSTDLIFRNGLDDFIIDCNQIQYPSGLTQISDLYRNYNDGYNFGESTNTSPIFNISTNQYLTLSEFSLPTPNTRRRLVFNQAPTNYNPMDQGTVTISQCPGDFTITAVCSMPLSKYSTFNFSNRPEDNDNINFCVLDSEKVYYFNLVMSPDPMNTQPSCERAVNTECAVMATESIMN